MRLRLRKKFKWNNLALAFAIPFFSFCLVLLIGGYQPFGSSKALLYSDQYHQYYPFFLSFRRALLSGDSLLYNWDIGMGLDYVGLLSYYLASPLNLLSVLVPEGLMLEYFCLLTPVKLGLASLFFALLLKKTFRKDEPSIALFGALYGLCAWALGYQWNIMWLDTFALLPLVILGTISLLRDGKFILYTVALFLSVCANYYVGFFTCIFVLLFFICYEICRFRSFARLCTDLLRIGFFTVISLGMTAIVELPTLAALQTTQSSVNNFPEGFRLNIADENTWAGLFDAMRQVAGNMGGGITPSWKEGLPNLYCGTGTIILSFLFLSCRQVKLRDKICSVLLLLFFMVSFIIRQLDYIWHGFHFTNMIPYRFSFLFSFVMLYMAYRAYLLRRHFKLWQLILSCVLTAGILLCSNNRTDVVFIAYNAIFLILYFGVMLLPVLLKRPERNCPPEVRRQYNEERDHRRKFATTALSAVFAVEIAMNVINFGISYPYTGVSDYPKGTEDTELVVAYMEQLEKDTLFYRAEVTHSQTLNDGALNGYHGISTFTSSANVKVTEFMNSLGYGARNTYNRYCFEESSPVSNLFLDLKYMIERGVTVESNAYFDNVYQSGNVALLKNNAYLPLGFLAEIQLANLDFAAAGNTFDFQNKLLKAAAGISDNVWTKLQKSYLTVSSDDVQIKNATGSGFTSYQAGAADGTLCYSYTADRSGFLCIDLNLPKKNSYTVLLNGHELYKETYSLPQCLSVSDVVPGDVVEIRFTCKAGESGTMTVECAIMDEQVFREAYDILSASTLQLSTFSNTLLEGTVDCNRDGLLYTSIPQNGNWKVLVDGKEVDAVLIADVMIGVPLTAGEHTVTFRYENDSYSLGWKVSLGCFLVFSVLTAAHLAGKRKTGKFHK